MKENFAMNPLAHKSIPLLLFKFALPSMVILLINSLYNIVDQFFIGNSIGYLGNGATNVIMPLSVLAGAISAMLGDGTSTYFNLYLGKGETKKVNEGAIISILSSIVISLIFSIVAFIFLEPICTLFGANNELLPYCLDYGKYIVIGYPFIICASVISSLIRSDGNPSYSMIAIVSGAIVNCILDPLFITAFNMGIEGAAIATLLSQILSFVLTVCYLDKFEYCKLSIKNFKYNSKVFGEILKFGISSFISQIAVTLVLVICNNLLSKYGATSQYGEVIPLTVFGIVMKINTVIFSIAIGFASGSQPIISFNYGAGLTKRVKEVFKLSVLLSTITMLMATVIYQLFPEPLISIFGSGNDLYIEFASKCFRIYLLFAITHGFIQCSSVFFQSIGKSKQAVFLSFSRQIIFFLPLVILLPIFFSINGILMAGAMADLLSFICCLIICKLEFANLFKNEDTVK